MITFRGIQNDVPSLHKIAKPHVSLVKAQMLLKYQTVENKAYSRATLKAFVIKVRGTLS